MSCCSTTILMRWRPDVRRPRGLTQTDRATWAVYVRHIAPLAGNEHPELPPKPEPAPPAVAVVQAAPQSSPLPQLRQRLAPLVVDRQPGGLDNSTWNRFRAGKLAATRTLDLHGRTAQRAFHALQDFLHRAAMDRQRCVEVITGRGSGPEGGVIRRELPLWLNLAELRPLVLAAAYPHPANTGAVRLLLRRPR
jgi:DNA-nicking Smr family endonuclease